MGAGVDHAMTGIALPTVNVSVALPVPKLFVAVRATENVPAAVGVPEISPIAGFMDKPAGKPVAPQVMGEAMVVRGVDPGAASPAEASSRTKIQSLESGGEKFWFPLLLNVPRFVVAPVCGLNHHPWTVSLLLVIPAMLMVTLVAFPLGI